MLKARRILLIALCLACAVAIYGLNHFGHLVDSGSYNEDADRPVSEAFRPARGFSGFAKKMQFIEGQDAVLSGAGIGGGIKYQWYFEDEAIPGANENVLLIHGIQKWQTGKYSLYIENELGSGTIETQVRVIPQEKLEEYADEKPELLSFSPGGVAIIGRPYALIVTATGEGNKYQWFKNDVLIINANTHRLFFNEIKRHDSGEYRVKISNENGVLRGKMFIQAQRESHFKEDS